MGPKISAARFARLHNEDMRPSDARLLLWLARKIDG